jgi:hypothetical protein
VRQLIHTEQHRIFKSEAGCWSAIPRRRSNAVVVSEPTDLSCIGLVTTLSKVVEDGLGVVGDAWWRGDLLVAEVDGGGPQRS